MSASQRRRRADFSLIRRFRRDLRGVSPVVGSLLMYAILITSATTMRVAIVPNMDEGREAGEMALVAERFAALKMDADRQLSDGHNKAASTLVPMRAQAPANLLSDGQSATTLRFVEARNVTLEARELRVQSENGGPVVGTKETWTALTGTTTIENILDIKHLRVRIVEPHSAVDGDNLTLTLQDKNGAFTGDLIVYVKHHPSGYSVNVKVRDAGAGTLFDQGNSYFGQERPAIYWVDALTDHMQFADVIAQTEGPYSLELTPGGLTGAFTTLYVEDTAGGRVLTGDAGRTYPAWNQTHEGLALRHAAPNLRYIAQDHILENGGVVVEQPVGDTFSIEPELDVVRGANRTTVRLSVPSLTGTPGEWAGVEDVSVTLRGEKRTGILATAPHFAMNVSTDHPHVWTAFWTGKFQAAELQAHEFAVTSGDGWARFDLYGHEHDPTSLTHDLSVDLHHGSVRLQTNG